jgi:bifunctional DNA-binding transcriptional regulator/antitoxin component of YhaV-PrlF toxin-antitoxin module
MPVVIKVTSKGQLTIPVKYRRALGIDKESYLLVDEIGEFLVLKKIQKLDQITKILSATAKEKGITKEDVLRTLKKIQEEKWNA